MINVDLDQRAEYHEVIRIRNWATDIGDLLAALHPDKQGRPRTVDGTIRRYHAKTPEYVQIVRNLRVTTRSPKGRARVP